MALGRWHDAMRQSYEETRVQFVLTELDLAITFSQLATSARDDERARRNKKNARKAYDAAIHFLADASLNEEVRKQIDDKVGRLRPLLQNLGEEI